MNPTTTMPVTTRAWTRTRLYTPGPVEIPARVLRALSQVAPHHRTDVFRATFKRVTDAMRELHGTEGEVFLLAASGTGAMEAAVVNLMSPGEKALAVGGGKFGERWAALLKAYGVPHDTIDVEWGKAADPAAIEAALARDPSITTVFATHSETSTGALHDVEAFAKITRARGKRLVIDGVTSIGVHPLPQDAWGIDCVVCGSQKGLMAPPGVATVSLAPWAAAAIEKGLPRFYFDLRKARKSAPQGESAFTPAVSLLLAIEEALTMIREEGLSAVHDRHRRLALATRAGAKAAGYALFSPSPSHAVTALTAPEGIDPSAVVKRLRDVHGMVVAGGQDQLKGKILRVGHMGAYDLSDIVAVVSALEECACVLGTKKTSGAADAARAAWDAA
jgi:aspartate aminotransferase-like enzyme